MKRRAAIGLAALAGAAAGLLLLPSAEIVSQTISQVFVTNFPAVQSIDGEVAIRGPVRQSELRAVRDVVVPPVRPDETTRLVDAGLLVTDGFPNVVLSLHGVVRGEVAKPGRVGAILVPSQETIRLAFDEQGATHFAMEVASTEVSAATPYFASGQPRHTVAFQAYRVLLYNTTDKTVTVNLFAYLTT